jgi:hypothetical protein
MPVNMRQDERIEVFSFIASYEGLSGLLIDLDLYVFNKAGELIECQPIWKGKTVVVLSERELSNARVMIGPPIRDSIRGPITMDMITMVSRSGSIQCPRIDRLRFPPCRRQFGGHGSNRAHGVKAENIPTRSTVFYFGRCRRLGDSDSVAPARAFSGLAQRSNVE